MISPPVLRPTRWDLPMTLLCDASDVGVGAALTQIDENDEEFVIEFYSAKLSDNEKKFSPTEKECLAVIKAIKHFRPYIELMDLRIITDHYSLKYLLSMNVTSGRLARWILFLQPYVNCISHRAGKLMKVPDALSRAPIMTAEDDEKIQEVLNIQTENPRKSYENLLSKVKLHIHMIPHYRIDGNKLYVKVPFKRNKHNDDWRLYPHPEFHFDIIRQAHEDTIHSGIRNTINKIQEKFCWKRMSRDVRNFVKNCLKCALIKSPNYKLTGPMFCSRIPKRCMEVMSCDIKGPLPAAGVQRFKYIFVVMDLLSRYTWIKLLKDATSHKIIAFLKEVFQHNGFPDSLIHDNGKQFVSDLFMSFLDEYNINSVPTPIYCAKNNPTERFNRTLVNHCPYVSSISRINILNGSIL